MPSYFHFPLLYVTDICRSRNELNRLNVLKPHLRFNGASIIAFFETVVRTLDPNGVVDGRYVREDNKTTGPEVVFSEVTVTLK